MRSILITLDKSSIEISESIEVIQDNPILIDWLENNFQSFEETYGKIVITDEIFRSNEGLFSFKNSLEFRLKNIDINFCQNFSRKIESELNAQENFKEFSLEASKIWAREYDLNHFNKFCNVLEQELSARKLYKYQLLSAYHLAFAQNSCNFSVPGSGKTSIVFGAFSYLNSLEKNNTKYVDKLLIVGPYSSFDPWEEEFELCFGRKPKIFRVSDEKSKKIKMNVLKGIIPKEYDMILTTYNSVLSLKNEMEIYLKSNRCMMVCDEAHKIKNIEGAWANSILKIAPHAKSRVVLTGTPCPNGYEDLYNLFKFIYPDKNIIQFNYSHLQSMSNSNISNDVDQLKKDISPFSIRIKKSHLNLPPFKDHIPYENVLSDFENEIYNKILNEISNNKHRIGNDKKNGITFALHHRLVQSSSNIRLLKKPLSEENIDTSNIDEIDLREILGEDIANKLDNLSSDYIPSKHQILIKKILPIIQNNQKVIIWARYINSIKNLHKLLSSNGLNGDYIIGDTGKEGGLESERSKIIKDFKNNNDSKYLITSPMVLGESVSLHRVCHHAFYLEMDYNAATYFQSRDRIHRVWLDSKNNQKYYDTDYYHIVSKEQSGKDTIDTKIFNRVNGKLKRMLQIIEDDIPLFIENENSEIEEDLNDIINEYRFK